MGAELPNPLVVKVLDAGGNAVEGQTINFRVTVGGGAVFAGASTTNAEGIAQERWTLGTVAGQDQTVEARAVDNSTGQAVVFAAFHATATPDVPAALKIVRQPAATAQSGEPLTTQPTVQLVDKFGNAVARAGVDVTAGLGASANGRSLLGTATVATDNTGLATFTNLVLSGGVGSAALSFSANGLAPAMSTVIALAAGAPAQLAAAGPTAITGTVGTALTTLPRVVVRDAAGNVVSGVSVTFAVSNNGGTIAPLSATTDANGETALGSWTLPKQPGTAIVVVSASAIPNASVTFTATVTTGAPTHLVRVDNGLLTGVVGAGLAVPLHVTDDFGNPIPGASVAAAVGGNSGAVSAAGGTAGTTATATSDASGTVIFTWTLGTATGQQTLLVSLSAGPSLSLTATAVAGPATTLAILTQPSSTAQSGQALATQPAVRLTDMYGNSVAQGGVQVTAGVTNDDKGRAVSGGVASTDGNGIATFAGLTITGVAGTLFLTFSAPNLAAVTSTSIALGTGAATQLKAIGPTAFVGTVNTILTTLPKVVAQDAGGNPIAGVFVQFTPLPGSGSVTPSTAVTDANGYAALTSWMLGTTAGSQTVTATAPTIAGGGAVTFTATARAGPAAQVIAVAGDVASVAAGQAVTLIARVSDAYGNPASDVTVTWAIASSGGGTPTLSAPSSVTDAAGQASVVLTAPTALTTVQVRALTGSVSTTFSITVIPITRTWVGGVPGAESDWSNASNWNPVGVPTRIDSIVIPVTSYKPHLVADTYVKSVIVAPGTELQLNGHALTFECCSVANFSGAFTGSGTFATIYVKTTAKITGPTTVPNLEKYWGYTLDLNKQPLSVTGNLAVDPNGSIENAAGTIRVNGNVTLQSNVNFATAGSFDVKGSIIVQCYGSPCQSNGVRVPITMSGTGSQSIWVDQNRYQSVGSVTVASGATVSISGSTPVSVGGIANYGTVTVPAGSTVNSSITLYSGSTITVLGTFNGSCTKAATDVTYTGLTCQ